ncbi:hypothetical protein KR200_003412 [Drosophila serrata]|nr:hypothetical protein KR200_003412 [Drosophila serrata]
MSCLCEPQQASGRRNRRRHSGSAAEDDFDKVSIEANADDSESISSEPDPDLQTTDNNEPKEAEPAEYSHLGETRRKIRDAIAALNDDDGFDKRMARLLAQFESAIREEFERAQHSPSQCRQLAHIIIGLTDIVHSMMQGRALQLDENYWQRMCQIVGYYISCELCAAQASVEADKCIINRINTCLKLYVEHGEGGPGVHKEHVLRTLLAAPKLFNRASILSVLYSRLFPHWSMPSIMIQVELPDKLYIEYILIFYYWYRLEPDEDLKERIVTFADKFMRPSESLTTRSMYAAYLPKLTVQSTATRAILNYLRQNSCTSLHIASRMDNRPPQANEVVLSSDDEDSCQMWNATMGEKSPVTNHNPPAFLQNLCRNARHLEPCKRANVLFSGIDNSVEIVDLRDSDDEMEMFSVNFNVPASVDGIMSNSNSNSNDAAHQTSTAIVGEDDSVNVTRIYPSNLRTYERTVATIPPTATYTVPRIVNSYSCRRDSLHLVSTTAPHLVDQSVQTLADEQPAQDLDPYRSIFPRSRSSSDADSGQRTPLYHCRQSSSQNPSSNASETSLLKKQVTFSAQHLGATSPSGAPSSARVASKKSSIKRQRRTSKAERIEMIRRKAQHFQASERMFAKLDAKNHQTICDNHLTPTTSNASSGTPTRIQPATSSHNKKVGLPTPPASTHSSSSPCHVQSVSTTTTRKQKSKWPPDGQVKFYNELLSQQREKIQQRRLMIKQEKIMRIDNHVVKEKRKLNKKARKRQRKLLREEQALKAVQPTPKTKESAKKKGRYPIVRLKRINLKSHESEGDPNDRGQSPQQPQQTDQQEVAEEHHDLHEQQQMDEQQPVENDQNQDTLTENEEEEQLLHEDNQPELEVQRPAAEEEQLLQHLLEELEEQLQKHQEDLHQANGETQSPSEGEKPKLDTKPKRRRRRKTKKTLWTHVKNKLKKSYLQSACPNIESEADDVTKAVIIASIEPDPAPDEEPTAEPDPDPVPVPVPDTVPVVEQTTTATDPAAYEFDQELVPEVGNELEIIAAPMLEPEDGEDTGALLSPTHNLELVTSRVPVYLLNGESRDVSTPLSSSQFSSASGSEP